MSEKAKPCMRWAQLVIRDTAGNIIGAPTVICDYPNIACALPRMDELIDEKKNHHNASFELYGGDCQDPDNKY